MAFYETNVSLKRLLVVFRPLIKVEQFLGGFWMGEWGDSMEVLPVSQILDLIGIWVSKKTIYPLRKHPGLAMLRFEDKGNYNYDENSDSEDEDYIS
jgi:hypothetical protein